MPPPVTVTLARRVAPGHEAAFEGWAGHLTEAAARYPGFLGAGLLRPGRVGQDWHVIYRFATQGQLRAWEESPDRAELLDAAEAMMQTTREHRVSGLETWFEMPGRSAPAPPRWKMFVVSVACIYLLQLLLNLAALPFDQHWPLPLRIAVVAGSVTALMTWVVMPRLARLLESWLYAGPADP